MHCTIVIPAYNTAAHIAGTLNSCCLQTYKDFDVLVVDDGSTDGTYKEVERFLRHRLVSIIRYKNNRGLPSALDMGIKNAFGPVVTFVGSDDELLPCSLSSAVPEFTRDPELGYLWTNFRFRSGRLGWSRPLPPNETLWSAICRRGWWAASCQQFFRKEAYLASRGLDPKIRLAVDYQLAVRLGETGCRVKHVPTVTYVYNHPRDGSMSSNHRAEQTRCDKQVREESKRYMAEAVSRV